MRSAIAIATLLLGTIVACAKPHSSERAAGAVERAQTALISSFDPALPNLTLQAFLEYETDHAAIDWRTVECKEDKTAERAICVEAMASIDGQRSISVTVRIGSDSGVAPKLNSVEVIDDGLVRRIRLIELPAAIRIRKFRSPAIHNDTPPIMDAFAIAHS